MLEGSNKQRIEVLNAAFSAKVNLFFTIFSTNLEKISTQENVQIELTRLTTKGRFSYK